MFGLEAILVIGILAYGIWKLFPKFRSTEYHRSDQDNSDTIVYIDSDNDSSNSHSNNSDD